jgi:hypothetical protein
MNPNQIETNDLAMLAGMVKGNMRKIDSLMTDLSDRPSDNIDIRKFLNEPKRQELPTVTTDLPQQPILESSVQQNHQLASQPPSQPPVMAPIDDKINQDIESIKLTLEKINVNLTKLTGMFGKVFQSLTNSNKNG